jgi:hypothetical protein
MYCYVLVYSNKSIFMLHWDPITNTGICF